MKKLLYVLLTTLLFQSCDPSGFDDNSRVIGIKIYDHQGSFDALFKEWKSIGINTAFVSAGLLANDDFRKGADRHQIKTFLIMPVFFDEVALMENPGIYAIKSDGEQAIDEWVKFICPANNEFKQRKISSILKLFHEYHPDGLSIDFIRHFVFWEKVYPDASLASLPNTCFDPLCIRGFEENTGIVIPETLTETSQISTWILENHLEHWTNWKCKQITETIAEIVEKTRLIDSKILINIHIVPWRRNDFDNAIRRIAGQEVTAIANYANYLSPMTYSHMVKRDPKWVHDVVNDLFDRTKGNILPSIQVKEAYLPDTLGSEEFEQNLKSALRTPSKGVIFWSWEYLEQDPRKKEIIKRIVK